MGGDDIGIRYPGDMFEAKDDGWEVANVINSSEDKGESMTKYWKSTPGREKAPKLLWKTKIVAFAEKKPVRAAMYG